MTSKTTKLPEIYAVLLVGGKGERFWPLSTPERPKQFLRIFSNKTMIQETLERISPLIPKRNIFYVLPPYLVDSLRKEIKGIRKENIIVEPMARNTAPAIALATRTLLHKPDAIMTILPADHLISPRRSFLSDLRAAAKLTQKGYLVTFGIEPVRSETGYGYIEFNSSSPLGKQGFKVKRFREKPDKKTAQRYIKSGNFLWNSGIFAWRVEDIVEAFQKHHFETYHALLASNTSKPILKKTYAKLEATSIDYAIMEKAKNVAVLPARFKWDDVGSWTAVERHLPQGLDKNTRIGKLIVQDSEGCIAVAEDGEIALLGVRDLIVVKSGNKVLVCAKDRAADVKKILAQRARLKP